MMMNADHQPPNHDPELDDHADQLRAPQDVSLDILIVRLADGDATDADWSEFQLRAASDRIPWQRLAEEQYITTQLRQGFTEATSLALNVRLPHEAESHQNEFESFDDTRFSIATFARTYGGWFAAAAAVLALAINLALPLQTVPNDNSALDQGSLAAANPNNQSTQSLPVVYTPDQHYQEYLDAPHVVRELPPMLMQARTNESGQRELIYMRRIVERQVSTGLFELRRDENNNPIMSSPVQPRRNADREIQ